MKRVAAVLVLGFLASAQALAFRCGTRLVSEGDTRSQVIAKCGDPSDVANQGSVFRRPVFWNHGRRYYAGENFIEVPIETWVYNLGPNKLMRRLRFEGGVVVEITTLGYGYHE